jgi:hypothetical protein
MRLAFIAQNFPTFAQLGSPGSRPTLLGSPGMHGGAKFSVVAVSPITKTFGDSAAGAGWGPALKDAGLDLLVIQGAADAPVYLLIHDDRVEIRDATGLWGLDTVATVDAVRRGLGDPKVSVAAIGPAKNARWPSPASPSTSIVSRAAAAWARSWDRRTSRPWRHAPGSRRRPRAEQATDRQVPDRDIAGRQEKSIRV